MQFKVGDRVKLAVPWDHSQSVVRWPWGRPAPPEGIIGKLSKLAINGNIEVLQLKGTLPWYVSADFALIVDTPLKSLMRRVADVI